MRQFLLASVLLGAGLALAGELAPAPETPKPADPPAAPSPLDAKEPAPAEKETPEHAFYREKTCLECHLLAQKETNPKGSPLWFSGTKYRAEFLEKWLQTVEPIRTLQYGTLRPPVPEKGDKEHPKLNEAEAKRMVAFLLALKDPQPPPAVAAKEPPAAEVQTTLTQERCSCVACHQIWTNQDGWVGGFSGPVLAGVGKRVTPEWIKAFFQDPRRFEPLGRMPNLSHRYRADPEMKPQKASDLDDIVRTVAAFPAGDETVPGKMPRGAIDPTANEIPADGSPVQQRFWRFCAQCHGVDAQGTGPNGGAEGSIGKVIKKSLVLSARDRNTMRDIIRDGARQFSGNPVMPSWGNSFKPAEIEELADLVFGFRKTPPARATLPPPPSGSGGPDRGGWPAGPKS